MLIQGRKSQLKRQKLIKKKSNKRGKTYAFKAIHGIFTLHLSLLADTPAIIETTHEHMPTAFCFLLPASSFKHSSHIPFCSALHSLSAMQQLQQTCSTKQWFDPVRFNRWGASHWRDLTVGRMGSEVSNRRYHILYFTRQPEHDTDGHTAHNTTVDQTFNVTNTRNEGRRYIQLSTQHDLLLTNFS
jgi:hypothetical protein